MRTNIITFRLSDEEVTAVREVAAEEGGESFSVTLRQLVREALKVRDERRAKAARR